jgi:DNA polymerase I-like protein with 3'-5' exonuclease and polymerase domains
LTTPRDRSFQAKARHWFRENLLRQGEDDLHPPDTHTKRAMAHFGVAREDVTPQMRSKMKIWSFGTDYGCAPFIHDEAIIERLSTAVGTTVADVRKMKDEFDKKFPSFTKILKSGEVNFARLELETLAEFLPDDE